MNNRVLDASAILAYLQREAGWELVEEALRHNDCMLSTVNRAEVIGKLAEKQIPETVIANALAALALTIVEFDSDLSMTTGLLRPATSSAGLSLGDRACLALAKHYNAPALTADQNWQAVTDDIAITLIR